MTTNLQPGDRVAYSARFLRSIGVYLGAMPLARGVVQAIEELSPETRIVRVSWDRDVPARVNAANLVKVTAHGILEI